MRNVPAEIIISLVGFSCMLLGGIACAAGAGTYVEDFTTWDQRDPVNTTVRWDTIAGEIKLHPFEPGLVGSCNTPGAAYRVAIQGGYAYVADWDFGITVMDISDPSTPFFAGGYNTLGYARDVAVSGDIACIADDFQGLKVFDISDPSSPYLLGSYDTPDYSHGVAIRAIYAYVADHDSGLYVIDISDPTSPAFAGRCQTPPKALDVVLSGDFAYVACKYSGLQIVDISEPTNPEYVSGYDTPGASLGIAVSGDHAYLADWSSGLQVVDVHDPADPIPAGSYDTPSAASDVVVSGDYAYVADSYSGLQVIDVSDPTRPKHLVDYDTPAKALGIAFSGDLTCIADFTSGLHIVDVPVGTFDTSRNVCHSLNLEPGIIVSTARLSTVQTDSIMWEVTADSGAHWQELLPGTGWTPILYPGPDLLWRSTHVLTHQGVNPTCSHLEIDYDEDLSGAENTSSGQPLSLSLRVVNPVTTPATISFTLSAGATVRLTIHDVRGRRIASLANHHFERGHHVKLWHGKDESGHEAGPGIYIVRMDADGFPATHKIVVLR